MSRHSERSNSYNKVNTVQVPIRLNKNTDQDILKKLESVESKQGYIKRLIREDMERSRELL